MPTITLPDGSQKQFDGPVTVQEVAQSIGAGLAKAALAAKVDGKLLDTSRVLDSNVDIAIITDKDQEGLDIIRHSSAHLLAHAVKQLFPEAQVTIGPVIEDGFYYDFSYPPGFTPEDLIKIEERMTALAENDFPVSREEISRDDAIRLFRGMGEEYKAKIIEDIPSTEILTIYRQGDFVDLCRGPHTPSTGKIKAFKLTKLAGAYWRGDSNNEMLQRIYGTAWPDKKQLSDYITRLEEAEKRDHRKIAKKMDLFHIQEEAPGMIFWHPNGATLYNILQNHIRHYFQDNGYQEIRTPQLVDCRLWEKSGHLAMFSKDMFLVEADPHTYAIKPMNCPCHIQVFNQGIKSYRDLPLRLAEFGSCHRNEPSGTLHGLMRLRNFVQDDAHIFCTEDQIQSEVSAFIDQLLKIYADFGFTDVLMKLSTRPDNRIGDQKLWDKAEKALEEALNNKGIQWELNPGEGAFYGPKIEFSLKDCIGRVWQCGTMQVDFSMPGRLDARYIAEDGSKQTPVMLHRAMLGSMERFLGILIEHYAGQFPTWLAPVQAVIMNITENQRDAVLETASKLKQQGLRVITDLRNEKVGFKIREHTIARVPYLVVIGDREKAAEEVAVRTQSGEDLGSMTITAFTQLVNQ
ncbi:threonine--tRNA ligase [Nitrospira sp. BLG_2]|uniref:threonine--tRNA ligase n=1 Tax=Nitrospira sp. BLG_2 TaxID=3397507 RepID=UPI003B9D8D5C